MNFDKVENLLQIPESTEVSCKDDTIPNNKKIMIKIIDCVFIDYAYNSR